jgi:hypothetical protein
MASNVLRHALLERLGLISAGQSFNKFMARHSDRRLWRMIKLDIWEWGCRVDLLQDLYALVTHNYGIDEDSSRRSKACLRKMKELAQPARMVRGLMTTSEADAQRVMASPLAELPTARQGLHLSERRFHDPALLSPRIRKPSNRLFFATNSRSSCS